MWVGIDGYYLAKPRGLGRYVQELLYALGRYAGPEFEFLVVVPESVPLEQYVMPDRIQYVVAKNAAFPVWEQWRLPREFRRLNLDVAHFPYNTRSLLFKDHRPKRVVTIHDLIYMDVAQGRGGTWYQNLGNRYRKAVVSRFSPSGQVVVTDSQKSADEIESQLKLSSTVVYISTEYGFRDFTKDLTPPRPLGLSRYFLHVGGTSPHKNTERCVQAFLASSQEDTALVVLGLGENTPLAIQYAGENVIFPGWVSEKEMASYYSHAVAILFPSLMEGYGLPIVEGFTLGVPVITSDLQPMREIAGGAALLVDPYSIESICKAICRIGMDSIIDDQTRLAGRKRLEEINGKNMAEKMIQIYRGAAACQLRAQ